MIEIIDVEEEVSVEDSNDVNEEVLVEAVELPIAESDSVSEEVTETADDEKEEKLTERKLNIEELMRTITLILSVYNTALLGLVLVVLTDGVSLTFPVLFMIVPILFLVVIACVGFIIYWGVNSIALSNLQEKKEKQFNGEG